MSTISVLKSERCSCPERLDTSWTFENLLHDGISPIAGSQQKRIITEAMTNALNSIRMHTFFYYKLHTLWRRASRVTYVWLLVELIANWKVNTFGGWTANPPSRAPLSEFAAFINRRAKQRKVNKRGQTDLCSLQTLRQIQRPTNRVKQTAYDNKQVG